MANTAKSDAYKHKKALESARLTKAQTEKLHEWQLMQEMGKALGIDPPKPITDNPLDKHVNTRIAVTPGLLVTLSVRRSHSIYEPAFQFKFQARSIMRCLAEMEAKKAATDAGLVVRFVISATSPDEEKKAVLSRRPIGRPKHKPDPMDMPLHLSIAEQALAHARAHFN